MQSRINSKLHAIWKRMLNKEYRDAFVVADNSNTVSAQIASMRQNRKWTQKELAERCGMRQPRISALEDPDFENVEISTLQRIASAFDVALLVSFVPFSDIVRRSTEHENSDFSVVDFVNDNIKIKQKTIYHAPSNHILSISGTVGYYDKTVERFQPLEFGASKTESMLASKTNFSSTENLH